MPHTRTPLEVGLNAVIVAMVDGAPHVFTATDDPAAPEEEGLPFGPYDPALHRTLEIGLRAFVAEQTPLEIGYVEQLYTFGDRGRYTQPEPDAPHFISIGYLALTRAGKAKVPKGADWRPWYLYFPWEDWRNGKPAMIDELILPALQGWIEAAKSKDRKTIRTERVEQCFAPKSGVWDDEKVLERFELLYEAGLVFEAIRDAEIAQPQTNQLGPPLLFDHRRVLATAMSRLRAKIKYRPVVFELMPPTFTLTQLQSTVEAIAGSNLHKQNFRRLVEQSGLVEQTGQTVTGTGGRPAAEFRFRPEALRERLDPGVKLPGRRRV